MIIQHEIPLLEYDDLSPEVIAPDHGCEGVRLPEKCFFAFLGDVVHACAREAGARKVLDLITVSHRIPVYVLPGEEEICLVQSPIGAAAAAQVLDSLIACGCRRILAAGSCGVLADLPENAFLVPVRALRAEGTSYHYLPPSRFLDLDPEPLSAIRKSFERQGLPFVTCVTWSTDGFFRETRDMVKYRLAEGCQVVEMECAALAACSRKRGAKFGQFLFTADSLANVHAYDERDFGTGSHEKALALGLEILKEYDF